ncbi:MAG: hypothetical protein ACI3X1_05255 [Eubacteriales bacterium]
MKAKPKDGFVTNFSEKRRERVMKKVLSILLAAAMLITAFVVVAVPVSAADGEWSVYTIKSQYLDSQKDTDMLRDIPGYEYTDEGLKMIPGKWVDSAPYGTFQTTDTWDISDGIYLQVRVDDFSYDAGDSWFGFSIWDTDGGVELGKQGGEYGLGVETLIHMKNGSAANESDKTTWAGALNSFEWFKDIEAGQRVKTPQTAEDKALYQYTFDENKKPILTLEIRWDDANEGCEVFINNSPAPDEYNQALNSYFSELNYQAYIGFSFHNSKKGGTGACTILKFGTSAEDATTPVGDDEKDPVYLTNDYAEIAAASTVPANKPAILLNASSESNGVGKISSYAGNKILVNDDNSVNITANLSNIASASFRVASDCSYDIKDFPITLIITKNLCTCTYRDNDNDGKLDAECTCTEKFNTFIRAGEIIMDDSNYLKVTNPISYLEPFTNADGDSYLYFIVDWSSMVGDGAGQLSGRIHQIRIDNIWMKGDDANRNNFDICEVGFFRSSEEAIAYFEKYNETVIKAGSGSETGSSETPTETETVTEAPTETETVTETPTETETVTEAPTEAPTKAPEKEEPTESNKNNNANVNVGCGSVVGVGAIAVVALAAAGLVSFKKKED